jgi:chromate reductase, NAD(P)H dehydrogenase (quinone)
VLRAVALLAPADMTVETFDALVSIPPFNPDDDRDDAVLPASVLSLRAAIANCDALLISSPEYAHGVPGSLKNALDWLVSGPEMVDRPTGILTASTHSRFVHASLAETLRVMSTQITPATTRVVPLDGRKLSAESIAADPELSAVIHEVLSALGELVSRTARGPES